MIWLSPSQSSKYKLYQDRKLECLIHAPSLAWSPEPWIYISFNQYSLNVLVKNFQTSKINRVCVCVCDLKAKYVTPNQWPKQTDLCLCSPSSRIQTFMVSNWLPWLQSPTSPRNCRWVSELAVQKSGWQITGLWSLVKASWRPRKRQWQFYRQGRAEGPSQSQGGMGDFQWMEEGSIHAVGNWMRFVHSGVENLLY